MWFETPILRACRRIRLHGLPRELVLFRAARAWPGGARAGCASRQINARASHSGTGEPAASVAVNSSPRSAISVATRAVAVAAGSSANLRGAANRVRSASPVAGTSPSITARGSKVSTLPTVSRVKRKACTAAGGMTTTAGPRQADRSPSSTTSAGPDATHSSWCRPVWVCASISQRCSRLRDWIGSMCSISSGGPVRSP